MRQGFDFIARYRRTSTSRTQALTAATKIARTNAAGSQNKPSAVSCGECDRGHWPTGRQRTPPPRPGLGVRAEPALVRWPIKRRREADLAVPQSPRPTSHNRWAAHRQAGAMLLHPRLRPTEHRSVVQAGVCHRHTALGQHRPHPIVRRRSLRLPAGCPHVDVAAIDRTYPSVVWIVKPGGTGSANLADIVGRVERRDHHGDVVACGGSLKKRRRSIICFGRVEPQTTAVEDEPHHRQRGPAAAGDGCDARGVPRLVEETENVETGSIHLPIVEDRRGLRPSGLLSIAADSPRPLTDVSQTESSNRNRRRAGVSRSGIDHRTPQRAEASICDVSAETSRNGTATERQWSAGRLLLLDRCESATGVWNCQSRVHLGGDLRTGLRAGSRADLRCRAGSRCARRRSSRSRTGAGFASFSGTPPGGGFGMVGGRREPPPPPSSLESESDDSGEETKRAISAGTNSAAANRIRIYSSATGSYPPT